MAKKTHWGHSLRRSSADMNMPSGDHGRSPLAPCSRLSREAGAKQGEPTFSRDNQKIRATRLPFTGSNPRPAEARRRGEKAGRKILFGIGHNPLKSPDSDELTQVKSSDLIWVSLVWLGLAWLNLAAGSSGRAAASAHTPSAAFFSGSERMRLPVTAKMALATAGAIGGVPGSPSPPHLSPPERTKWVSITGASDIRAIG
jgi:hypothetical protein